MGMFGHRLIFIEASFGSQLCFRLLAMKTPTVVETLEVRECLLSCGAEPFVFQFAVQKLKD